jgi:hypothetical protein
MSHQKIELNELIDKVKIEFKKKPLFRFNYQRVYHGLESSDELHG